MKKLLFLSLCFVITSTIFAQNIDLLKTQNPWLSRGNVSTTAIGQDDDNNYLYVSYKFGKNNLDYIYTINKETLEKSAINILTQKQDYLLNAINTPNNIIALYRSTTKKGDFVTFSIANIEKGIAKYTHSNTNSITTNANTKFWPEYKTAKSPNEKYMAALVMVTGKKSLLENLYAVVVNNEGEFVWQSPITPSFKGTSFALGNIAVDNNGNLFIPAYSCNLKGDKVYDVQFQVIMANGNETRTFTTDENFGKPQNFFAKVLKDGQIAIGGYFTNTYENTMTKSNGYFLIKFNSESENFSKLLSYDFSSNYAQKKAPAMLSNILGNQQYSINADNILELENGGLVLLGEHRFIKKIRDAQGFITYQILTKNTLISTIMPDETSKFSMIQKQQMAAHTFIPDEWKNFYISYSAFVNNNDVYVMFNDHNNNIPYPGKGVVCGISGLKFNKPGEMVLMKLSPDQEITQMILPDKKNQLMRSLEFVDNDNFYVSGLNSIGVTFNKFSISND